MNQLPGRILAQCLDAVESGEATLEECVTRYPQYSEELGALLGMTDMLRNDPSAGPRPSYRRIARRRLLAKLPPRAPSRRGIVRWPLWPSLSRRAATAWIVAVASLVVLLCSSGIVFAAERTLPGDVLYPVKTTVEEARLWMARGGGGAYLSLHFAETRIDEIRHLGTAGRFDDLTTAAGRFEAQMQRTDRALRELAERDAGLAEALAAQSQEARTTYRQELVGLLQAAPDLERATIEDILERDDALHPAGLLDDRQERETHPADAAGDDVPVWDDDSPQEDEEPSLQEEPREADEDKDTGDDDRGVPEHTDDALEHGQPESDTGTIEERDGEDHEPEEDPQGPHDADSDGPEQNNTAPEDDSPGNTPDHDSAGDDSAGHDGSDDGEGSGEHAGSGEHDSSDEPDGSDTHHDPGESEEPGYEHHREGD